MDTRAFDAGVVLSALPQLLEFLDITLLVGISSIVLGSLLGGVLAWAKLSQHKILNYLAQLYIYIMRCTPSIVMLFIVFYGLPALLENSWPLSNLCSSRPKAFSIPMDISQ